MFAVFVLVSVVTGTMFMYFDIDQYILPCLLSTERPGTPLRRFDPENLYTTSPVKLKHVRRNINAIDIDAVADILRDAIQKECKALECDIEFLQVGVYNGL